MDNDTNQTTPLLDENGKFAKGNIPPAGFNKHPENQSPGGWRKEMVFSYQYKRFMNMTLEEMELWNTNTPKDKRTVVEDLAFKRVYAAQKSLPDVREITDRTEGRAAQSIDLTSKGERLPTVIIEGVYGTDPNFRPDNEIAEADSVAEDSSTESSTV
jgi:hypothetical protein